MNVVDVYQTGDIGRLARKPQICAALAAAGGVAASAHEELNPVEG